MGLQRLSGKTNEGDRAMNEVHIMQPIYYGDRTTMYVGIARFRLTKDGKPKKGNIRIWIDLKVRDKNSPNPTDTILAYRYPFSISCEKALTYKTQTLLDYHRTVLHIIPISDLKVVKTRRARTTTQEEFKKIVDNPIQR